MFKKSMILMLALVCFWSTASAKEYIKFQSVYPVSQSQNIEIFIPWLNSLNEKSQGELELEFFAVNDLVSVNSVNQAIKDGLLDIGGWSGGVSVKTNPHLYSTVALPFIAKSSQHGTELMWTAYEQIPESRSEVDGVGVLLAQWTSASYGISSINGAVRTPADIKGKRVMTITAGDSGMIEAWGGVPVYVSPSDVYIGLQRGMAEAYYGAIPYQRGLKLGEIIKHITVLPCTASSMLLSMNKELFADLDPKYQDLFTQSTGKAMSTQIAKHLDKDVNTTLLEFEATGINVVRLNEQELEVFSSALDSFRSTYWVNYLKDMGIADSVAWIERITALSDSIQDPNT